MLDDDKIVDLPDNGDVPGTYYRLAMDYAGRFGHKPVNGAWRKPNASRYVRMFQSRRSLLVWKVFGERTRRLEQRRLPDRDRPRAIRRRCKLKGTAGRRHAGEPQPGRPRFHGQHHAAAGRREGRQGGKPLTDEDRLTLVRWIDLGCPIDLDYDPENPKANGYGWMLDDKRPTLTLA